MQNHNQYQRLFWSLSRPLKYMGLTLDEWGVTLLGVVPGIILLNSAELKWGMLMIISGIMLCYSFKKYKKLSQNFKFKSFLIAKNIISAPYSHPKLLHKQRIGK